jgi:hypothetical protein
MKLQTLAAACAALATFSAAPAFASEIVTAKLQQPVAAKTKFIAGGAMFNCDGDQCVASAPVTTTYSPATCRAIAAKVGPVAAFTDGRKEYTTERLATCNKTVLARAAGGGEVAAK